jgi:DNA-binding LacI/PurR family transcriptional regulator
LKQTEFPTEIITANDIMAMAAVNAIDEENLNVPNNISVIGFDNAFAAYMRPKLTTISLPAYQLGQIGAQLILERIERRYQGAPRIITLPEELIIRGSTTLIKG